MKSLEAISGCSVVTPNCPSVPYGVTVIGPNDIIAGTDEQLRSQEELLWASQLTLTLNAPSNATITVDDQSQIKGGHQILLTPGEHLLLASEYVPVSEGVRLRFDHWSDGYLYAGRTIDLNSSTTLAAIYVTQYNLTLMSPLLVTGGGWYDEGSDANFSSIMTPQFGSMGVMIFTGWLNESGDLLTWWGNGSVVIDGPRTLSARWVTLNYSVLIVVAAILAIAGILNRRRKRNWNNQELPETTRHWR